MQAGMESPMAQPDAGADSRRWARHRIDVRLKVLFPHGSNNTSAFGRGNTISHGGLGAYIPCSIPVGTTVSLEVTFPYDPSAVKLQAVVRTCEGFRYGLEFVRVPEDVRTVIAKNCGSLAKPQ
jgi:hypothetical protein